MLKVGLTGGLASGKSFVGAALAELGCHLIQADLIGHQVLLPAGEAYESVVRHFGRSILNSDGTIDRRRLASQVFQQPEELRALNSLVHPAVRQRTDELIARFNSTDPHGIVVVEAAIHVETGGYKRFDRLILAYCTEQQQIERAMRRDGVTREEALARLRNQMPLAAKREYADYVIDTSGTKEQTLQQVRDVHESLRRLAL